jgi:hydrogenase/urease accessory protein HupE
MRRFASIALAGFACCAVATPAHAHLVQTGFGTFYDGIVHLALTPTDLFLVLALGLLAGISGAAGSRAVLLGLPGAWLVGGGIGIWFTVVDELAWQTTITFGFAGALVALNARLSRPILALLACSAGALHGYVNGATMTHAGADALSLLGAALAVFTLVTLTAALVVSREVYWQRIVVRVAGSWIAAVGILMLGWLARGQA